MPHGRNGHSLLVFGDLLVMFGGILEVTKESEDIYVFHIPSSCWKLVDMNSGPIDLKSYFDTAINRPTHNVRSELQSRNLEFEMQEALSNPDLTETEK